MQKERIVSTFDQKSPFKNALKVSLVVIGIIVSLSVLIMSCLINEQDNLSIIIGMAEKQSVLSQRIVKSTFGFEQTDEFSQKEFYYKELEFSVNLFKTIQGQLLENEFIFQFVDASSAPLLDSMRPYYDEILRTTGYIVADKEPLTYEEREKLVLSVEYYFKYMDELESHLSDYAKERNRIMIQFEMSFLAVILCLLTGFYFLVFKPRNRQTTESIYETKKLFDIAPTAIVIVDPKDFTIQEINDAGEALLQLTYEEALRMNLQDFISEQTKYQIQRFSEKEHEYIVKGIEAVIKDLKRKEVTCLVSVGKFNFGGREHLLVGLADITAQKETEEAFEKLATIDEMTGLFNRRTGLVLIGKEFEKAKRHIYDVTVCFIDMDGLKHVNDTFGHSEGDWYIRSVTTVIREGIRQGDIGMRFGGDEIVLGLVNCDEAEAKQIMSRIQTVLDLIIKTENKPYEMGISYGLSEYKKDVPVSVESFINYADERMYAVKTLKKTTRK